MAKPRKTRTPITSDLARLKIDPELVLEGGRAKLPVWVREGDTLHQPYISLWVDPESHFARAYSLVLPVRTPDEGLTEALVALVQACTGPFAQPELAAQDALPSVGESPTSLDLAKLVMSLATSPEPALPACIRVRDAPLAEAARTIFEPLGVAVELVDDLPDFDEALAGITESMGGPQDPPQPFAWELDAATLEPLYAAAAAFWRRKPWEFVDDYPPVVVEMSERGPRPNVSTLYASILGGAGEVLGVAFYFSPDALDRLVERGEELIPPPEIEGTMLDELAAVLSASGVPMDELSRDDLRRFAGEMMGVERPAPTAAQMRELIEDSLTVFYSPAAESDPTYLGWLAAHSLKYPSKQGVPSFLALETGVEHGRQPNAREARALTLALDALATFFRLNRGALEGGPGPFITMQRLLGMPDDEEPVLEAVPQVQLDGERIAVPVRYTVPLDMIEAGDEEKEQLPPASAAAPTTLYRFHVALEWKPDVWRRIEMRGDQTLEDLHYAIQDAFGWDDDHLYSFYLNGRAFDPKMEYCSPYADCERHVSGYRLENVDLRPHKKLLYLFDYGDELRHTVTVEAITKGGVEPRKRYPRIAERHGRRVPQYADW